MLVSVFRVSLCGFVTCVCTSDQVCSLVLFGHWELVCLCCVFGLFVCVCSLFCLSSHHCRSQFFLLTSWQHYYPLALIVLCDDGNECASLHCIASLCRFSHSVWWCCFVFVFLWFALKPICRLKKQRGAC